MLIGDGVPGRQSRQNPRPRSARVVESSMHSVNPDPARRIVARIADELTVRTAHVEAAASLLSPEGRFVVCGPSVPPGRTAVAMRNAGLHALSVRSVLPGPGRPAFLELVVAGLEPTEAVIEPELVLREADGRRNAEHAAIREWFGVPASVY